MAPISRTIAVKAICGMTVDAPLPLPQVEPIGLIHQPTLASSAYRRVGEQVQLGTLPLAEI
jgi:hypothetical protein